MLWPLTPQRCLKALIAPELLALCELKITYVSTKCQHQQFMSSDSEYTHTLTEWQMKWETMKKLFAASLQ